MAGHSQFKNIMHRKGAQDARRGRLFARLIREITVAAGQGLPDPAANPRLRAAVAAAREANMPKDTVERAIKKASGGAGGADYVRGAVRGLRPGRRRGDGGGADRQPQPHRVGHPVGVRQAWRGAGRDQLGQLPVHAGWAWCGIRPAAGSADDMLEAAIEAGADNAESDAEGHEVTCAPDDFFAVRDALEARFGAPESAQVEWRPTTSVTLDEERAATVLKLLEALEDSDDVQNVYANFDIPDAVMARLSA